jgi:hypothetical protein
MSKFDSYINDRLASSQFAVGVSTVVFSALSRNISVPKQALRVLDFHLVQVFILAFLIASQTKKPTLSILTAAALVYGVKFLTSQFAPETPPLSEILKPDGDKDKKDDGKTVTCNCSPQIVLPDSSRKPFYGQSTL